MPQITDALELLTAQHEQIEDLFEQVRQIGDEAAFVELVDKLTTHLALEQELFYPTVGARIALSRPVLDELSAEHATMKNLLSEMVWLGTGDSEFRAKLDDLGVLLVGHAGWQEDELFTRTAEAMSQAELAALCDRLNHFDTIAIAA